MPDERIYTAGNFVLDVMGASAGTLKKFDGFNMEADVVSNDLGPGNIPKKHVAAIRWTPARATIGFGMGKQLTTIIQQAFRAQPRPFDGALYLADVNYKVLSSQTFTGAMLTAVTFPKMDASSKDAAYFDLEWEAEQVRWGKGDNSDLRRPTALAQKVALSSNFRFEMGGLPCNRVTTIDSFTVRCATTGDETRRSAKVTVPNIKIQASMADFDAWLEAATKWFIDGAYQEGNEIAGAIVFLGADLRTEIGRVTLKNCGFARFMRGPLEANTDAIPRFSCEFYVEAMELTIK